MTAKPDQIPMNRSEVMALIAIEPILKRLGLSLFCLRCHGRGQRDGVRCDNDPTDKVLRVECGCCVRVYHRGANLVADPHAQLRTPLYST